MAGRHEEGEGEVKRYRDIAGDAGSAILAQVQEQRARVHSRLSRVKQVVAVSSGKGGVGKSVVVANLAAGLAQRGRKIGVLDADLNGPALGKMLGVEDQPLHVEHGHAVPAIGPLGIKVVSMALLLPGEAAPVVWEAPTQEDAYVWRGTMEAATAREFLADVDWDDLDYLFVDLPPGAERLPHLAALIPGRLRALVVTIPSQVSRMTAARAITLAQRSSVTMAGLIENMAGYVCPSCGAIADLFPNGDVEAMAGAFGLPLLGRVPFDPRIAACADRGSPFVVLHPGDEAARAFAAVASRLEEIVGAEG